MNHWQLKLKKFTFGDYTVDLLVPDPDKLRHDYLKLNNEDPKMIFPYWGKIWNSAIGLCNFLSEQPNLVKDKLVLELAAGLGMPSLMISKIARMVVVTDLSEDAVSVIQKSIDVQSLSNVFTRQLDWHQTDDLPDTEVLLLSDVNYHQQDLKVLYELILYFINRGTIVILSTPERIVARDFLRQLNTFQNQHLLQEINEECIHVYVFAK